MRVIIGSGKVANVIKNHDDVVLPHEKIEIINPISISNNLQKFSPGTVVINTAAKINLEWCESYKDTAHFVNVVGAVNLGRVCQKLGHHLVHISSGCIFDGMEIENVYDESATPTPASWYAKTKAEADEKLLSLGYEKITIVRPRQLISAIPHPTNMITKFLSLGEGKFIDSKNSVTCIEDMKEMIDHLIAGNHYGIYNLANEGWSSPYKIALKIKEMISKDFKVEKISYENHLKEIAVKRVNTLLSIKKLKATGYTPRHVDDALTWCLQNYGK